MQLEGLRFKEEMIGGKYRAHFRLHVDGAITHVRFGIECDKKPSDKELRKLVEERLKSISIKVIKEDREFRVGIDVD